VVDVNVITRDTWTINLNAKYSRSGGASSSKIGIQDTNLAGTALTLGYLQTSDPDRKGNEFEIDYSQAFDGRTQLAYQQGDYDDGFRKRATISVNTFFPIAGGPLGPALPRTALLHTRTGQPRTARRPRSAEKTPPRCRP